MKKVFIKVMDFITKGKFSKVLAEIKRLTESQNEWYNINAPVGKQLGYPQCCINEFCKQSPEVLAVLHTNNADRMRYQASLIDGVYSGFIPCKKHAKQILSGKITLQSLIQNRDKSLPPFPEAWQIDSNNNICEHNWRPSVSRSNQMYCKKCNTYAGCR